MSEASGKFCFFRVAGFRKRRLAHPVGVGQTEVCGEVDGRQKRRETTQGCRTPPFLLPISRTQRSRMTRRGIGHGLQGCIRRAHRDAAQWPRLRKRSLRTCRWPTPRRPPRRGCAAPSAPLTTRCSTVWRRRRPTCLSARSAIRHGLPRGWSTAGPGARACKGMREFPAEIRDFAEAFVALQKARQEADYALDTDAYHDSDVLGYIASAERAPVRAGGHRGQARASSPNALFRQRSS